MPETSEASLTREQQQIASEWERLSAFETECKKNWKRLDRRTRQLAKKAKLGRRKVIYVPISETHQLKILNQFQGVHEVIAHGFARKIKIEEVKRKD